MEKTVNYKGFDIDVVVGETASGQCWGKYQIRAASEMAQRVFAAYSVSGFGTKTIHQTSDERAKNPKMLDFDHLLEMAKHEIDMGLSAIAKR